MAEVKTRCYFRLSVDDEPGVFAQITRVLAEHRIGLASVIQREAGPAGRRRKSCLLTICRAGSRTGRRRGAAGEALFHAGRSRPASASRPPVKRGVLLRWAAHLPLTEKTPRLSLGEGDTPLIAAPSLAARRGMRRAVAQVRRAEPTGSFKDRGMVVAVCEGRGGGRAQRVCASTATHPPAPRPIARRRSRLQRVVP